MDINKTIELLKRTLAETEGLRTRGLKEEEFELWRDKVLDILEATFGKKSTEFDRFASAVTMYRASYTEQQRKEEYDRRLVLYETALKSIIQKYEILGIPETSETIMEVVDKPKAFVSHGKGEGALLILESFLNELGVQPIIVKDQPNLDRTVDEKVEDCLSEADFVIIFATGDDKIEDKLQPRQNVIHEIGLAQKTHPGKIIYLLEEGAEFPSNIRPKVYESFARQSMDRAFIAIVREMRKLGFLIALKPQE